MMKKIISLFLLIFLFLSFSIPNPVFSVGCGKSCQSSGDCSDPQCSDCRLDPGDRFQTCKPSGSKVSCGGACSNSSDCPVDCNDCSVVKPLRIKTCNTAPGQSQPGEQTPAGDGVNLKLNFDDLLGNIPIITGGGVIDFTNLTIEGIISALIPFIYVLAGLALLLMLIIGGFQLMMSAGDPKGVESGRNKVMYALIGFLIIFASFWLVQILQVVFGLPKIF